MSKILSPKIWGKPAILIVALVLVVLSTGIALAAYVSWESSVQVVVRECIGVDAHTTDGTYDLTTGWSVVINPTQTVTLDLTIYNDAPNDVPVTISIDESPAPGLTFGGLGVYNIASGSGDHYYVTITASSDITPYGSYTYHVKVSR